MLVEVGLIDDAFEVVGISQTANDLVDLLADLLGALELYHVGETIPGGHLDQRVGFAGVLVRHVLDEEQCQDIVLIGVLLPRRIRDVHQPKKVLSGRGHLVLRQCRGEPAADGDHSRAYAPISDPLPAARGG